MNVLSLKEIDEIRKKGLRPQVVCFCVNEGSVLLLHKSEYKMWMVPQGGIDNKESAEKAIYRELSEELGSTFIDSIVGKPVYLGEGEVAFNEKLYGDRDLETDSGEKIVMKGKKYFYFAVEINSKNVKIEKVEFDDLFWLDYQAARYLLEKTKQLNKKLLNVKILDILKDKLLIY